MAALKKIALLGTGLMGFPMAQNLLRAGHAVTVWNRSLQKAQPLSDDGAEIAPTAADAVMGADIIISMLTDGRVTGMMIDDLLAQNAVPASLWVDMSSIKPEEARAQGAALSAASCAYLDAPVSGGTKGAEAASLAIMVGGAETDFDTAEPVLQAMGRPVRVGGQGAGQLAKLANQAIVAITISAVAEATLLLERGGADPKAVRNALKGGFADSVILQQHGTRMSERDFVPGGASKIQLKDLNNALGAAAQVGLTLPTTQHVRDRYDHLIDAMQGGDLDHSALFLDLLARNSEAS